MKYNNKKTEYKGLKFDSKRELNRYLYLESLEKSGAIKDLKRQVKYELLPSQKSKKRTERPVHYIADFAYYLDGEYIVEDSKGCITKDYVIKRKLMLYIHDITITEV